ncbi:g11846 [Coccomyxa viridis]|uniref:G11846 protein n=1 Tax=Coccomyxa viridis TaxID=1274662 RepID=A0ABP1GFX9_9CHLO
MASEQSGAPVASSGYGMPVKKDLEEKNAKIAEDEVDASDIAAIRDNFITGETNFKQDMDSIKDKAQQQGTAQPELRDAAKDIKKDMAAKHPETASNRAS